MQWLEASSFTCYRQLSCIVMQWKDTSCCVVCNLNSLLRSCGIEFKYRLLTNSSSPTDYSQTVVVLQGLILLVLSSTCSTILVFFMNFPSPAISNNHRVKVDGYRFSLPFDLSKIFLKLQSLWWYSHPPPPQSLPHPLLTDSDLALDTEPVNERGCM